MAIRVVKLYGELCLVDSNNLIPYSMYGKIDNVPSHQYTKIKFLEKPDTFVYRPTIGPYLNGQLIDLNVFESAKVFQEYKLPIEYFPELMNQYAIVGTMIIACYSVFAFWILSLFL